MNAGNIGNVPLVLIAALCRDKSNPFGDFNKCSTDGTAYISFGQWVGLTFYNPIQVTSYIVLQFSHQFYKNKSLSCFSPNFDWYCVFLFFCA